MFSEGERYTEGEKASFNIYFIANIAELHDYYIEGKGIDFLTH